MRKRYFPTDDSHCYKNAHNSNIQMEMKAISKKNVIFECFKTMADFHALQNNDPIKNAINIPSV